MIENDRDRYARYMPLPSGEDWRDMKGMFFAGSWLSGEPIDAGGVIRLKKGRHAPLLQIAVDKSPDAWGKILMMPCFTDASELAEARLKESSEQKAVWNEYARTRDRLPVLKLG